MERSEACGSSTDKKRAAIELTQYMVHKHYCENDPEALIALFDEPLAWFGAGENEYASGRDTVSAIFREFAGKVPKCIVSEEEYRAEELAPDVYLCTGRMWIATDPATHVYLRVHQRITTVFRWKNGTARCCHIHISNPYSEMVSDDVGFPTQMARQTYEYMESHLREQEKRPDAQNAELASIYETIPCAIFRLARTGGIYRMLTFNQALADILGYPREEIEAMDCSSGLLGDVVPEDASAIHAALRRLKNPGNYTHVTYRVRDRSGQCIHLRCKINLISEGEDGQIIQYSAFNVSRSVELEALLSRLSFEDSLTGLFNRNRFNHDMDNYLSEGKTRLGVASLDLNGLKEVNDQLGHSAGDALLQRTAGHIRRAFPEKGYRIGGDEFIIIDEDLDEAAFASAIQALCQSMENDHIRIACGYAWRAAHCSVKEQLEEADAHMYQSKKRYYSDRRHDRRKN